MKVGLRFPLHRMLVEVLKRFDIYLQQLTPDAFIRVRVFIWVVRSQGVEPNANCFCNIHELLYQSKEIEKEQHHNNFGCYTFVYRSDAHCSIPNFRGKWPSSWIKQRFYVKNDLKKREDIKRVIHRPIMSRFSIKWPAVVETEEAQA
jgi:hypothetical protein